MFWICEGKSASSFIAFHDVLFLATKNRETPLDSLWTRLDAKAVESQKKEKTVEEGHP
jgi:hypothetical protein